MTHFYKHQRNQQYDQFTEEITDSTTVNIQKAQESIYKFLLELTKYSQSDEILDQFDHLFIKYEDVINLEAYDALGEIIFYNKGDEFKNTLLRCCYILNNNWVINNNISACTKLVDLFLAESISIPSKIYKLQRLRSWLQDFVESEEYHTLRSLSGGVRIHTNEREWSVRFSSYLLISDYADPTKSLEQRQYAKSLSRKLKKQFKFELAMYTARLDSKSNNHTQHKNPTNLGDGVLTLIKKVLNKQGGNNYRSVAQRFFEQVRHITFGEFKQELIDYLGIAQGNFENTNILQVSVIEKLIQFQQHRDHEDISLSLLNVTCKRTLQYILLDDHHQPSKFVKLAIDFNNILSPVILLLKVVLIFPSIRLYLETYIADLIRFYSTCDDSECRGFIDFVDVLNVTLAIFDEDTNYSLIKMNQGKSDNEQGITDLNTDLNADLNLDNYRVFSQSKKLAKLNE
jgi:hypothetical protein